ncbi:MAG TPA: flagellar basal-body protein [Azospirillum sp.]|nr:flagellar basal-body protein [Azospirillum sp.]
MDKIDVRTPKERKPGIALPRNAHERAVALLDVMGRLVSALDRETGLLRGRRPSGELGRLADEKQPLSLAFDELSRLLRIDREGMAGLAPDLKERLAAATQTLLASTAANAEALGGATKVQKILVDAVVAGINRLREQQPGVAYGPSSGGGQALRGYGAPTRGPATSATLNACF